MLCVFGKRDIKSKLREVVFKGSRSNDFLGRSQCMATVYIHISGLLGMFVPLLQVNEDPGK